ncbi:hypothetical protein IV203_023483 [Nitzschia inconspicua]|uniref:Uncharacterized protein n=1 Tax=Nitzschia inconspicua TaxID=303405 RepID=A0A9K3PCC9_9STRA|nr:hypothetical protein IV203_023483 [Nitzschia inconspicua]
MFKQGQGRKPMEGLGGPVTMDEYHFDGIDPSLEDCCRREVESNRRFNALTSTLRRHDVAKLAERRRRNLIKTPEFEGCRCCLDPNADGGEYRALLEYKTEKMKEKELLGEEEDGDDPVENISSENMRRTSLENEKVVVTKNNGSDYSNDSDDEFDYLLDEDLPGEDDKIRELEEGRRAELEYQLLVRQVARYHGYGVTRQLHPTRILKVAGLGRTAAAVKSGRPPPLAVVVHLIDPDSTASASLDYYFETDLAMQNAGTMFLRSGGRSTLLMDPLAQQSLPSSVSDPERDLPALVAIRDGVVVNVRPKLQGLTTYNSSHEGDEVEPQAVRQWLEHCGVLLKDPPPMDEVCFIRPEEDALMDYLSTQPGNIPQEERYDCGLEGCNKSFKHEHVGIQTSNQSGLVVKEQIVIGEQN